MYTNKLLNSNCAFTNGSPYYIDISYNISTDILYNNKIKLLVNFKAILIKANSTCTYYY